MFEASTNNLFVENGKSTGVYSNLMRRSSDLKNSKESTVYTRAMQSQPHLYGQDVAASSQAEVVR